MNSLERKLSYEDIRFYRSIAKSQLRKEKALIGEYIIFLKMLELYTKFSNFIKIIIARKQKENASQQSSQRGWLGGWLWGGSQSDVRNCFISS